MKTIITDIPEKAAEFIQAGELVAFPTETVYGLGADVFNETALKKIFHAKSRPTDNPLIVHIASLEQIELLAEGLSASAKKLIDAFFPAPLTIIVKKRKTVPNLVSANLDTVGIRMPADDIAREFIRLAKTPIAAPSANISAKPSSTRYEDVLTDLNGRIACVLKGNECHFGLESTVVDCSSENEPPAVLRYGSLSIEKIRVVCENITFISTKEDAVIIRSPGQKYKHYSPSAKVIIVANAKSLSLTDKDAFIGMDEIKTTNRSLVLTCKNIQDYAHHLFSFFRACDKAGIHTIYCQEVEMKDMGRGLMERLRKASS